MATGIGWCDETWTIVTGCSKVSTGYREMDLDWARSLRDSCVAAGVPYFFKQFSGPRPASKKTPVLLDSEEWHQFPDQEARACWSRFPN